MFDHHIWFTLRGDSRSFAHACVSCDVGVDTKQSFRGCAALRSFSCCHLTSSLIQTTKWQPKQNIFAKWVFSATKQIWQSIWSRTSSLDNQSCTSGRIQLNKRAANQENLISRAVRGIFKIINSLQKQSRSIQCPQMWFSPKVMSPTKEILTVLTTLANQKVGQDCNHDYWNAPSRSWQRKFTESGDDTTAPTPYSPSRCWRWLALVWWGSRQISWDQRWTEATRVAIARTTMPCSCHRYRKLSKGE